MSARKLTLACWRYDRTQPLIDGSIRAEGLDLQVSVMRPRVAFERMLAGDFDASEMSFANYVSMIGHGDRSLIALPVMLSKMFRHNCIYVREGSGVRAPEDLIGRRVGTMRYSSTALVYARGMLLHDYGVRERDLHWSIGGVNAPLAASRPSHAGAEVSIELLSGGDTLDAMLLDGRLDAIISQDWPESFLRRDPRIRRLFQDFERVEAAYFRRTRIFPIMHVIALKRELYEDAPWIARSLYRAFDAALAQAQHALYDTDALHTALPFLLRHVEEAQELFQGDAFANGVAANQPAIEALCDYVYEQGLSPRRVSPSELFAET